MLKAFFKNNIFLNWSLELYMLGLNIIIAEDHNLFRELLVSTLAENGITTIAEARNGIQLINALKIHNPDVVLLDVEMPDMDGAEALKQISVLYPKQKVMILTQHENVLLGNYFINLGARAFLTKNSETSYLIETLHSVAKGNVIATFDGKVFNSQSAVKFSQRESELIPLICNGKSNKEIADKLKIGNKTVEAHKKNLFLKTNTNSAVEFVVYMFRNGLHNLK